MKPYRVLTIAIICSLIGGCTLRANARRGRAQYGPAPRAHSRLSPPPPPMLNGRRQGPRINPALMATMRRTSDMVLPTSPSLGKPGRVIVASAPGRGISPADLGAPYDMYFHRIQGPEGSTLFPRSGPPLRVDQNYFQHRRVVIETREELAANIEAWGYGSAGMSMAETRRFASVRNFQVAYTLQLDAATQMRNAPPYATYYPSAIYYGRKYESAMYGSAQQFTARVAADFGIASGGIEAFKQTHRLQGQVQGLGLTPTSGAAIFSSPDSVQQHYRTSGEPVPIFVEYRQIPGRAGLQGGFDWQQSTEVEVRLGRLDVVRDGGPGRNWTLFAECFVNGAQVGQWPIWQHRPVKSGHSYDLSWVTRVPVYPGDRLECGIQGTVQFGSEIRGRIPTRRFIPFEVSPTTDKPGILDGHDHATGFRLYWSARAVR